MNDKTAEKYRRITEILIARGISTSAMESCTSGTIASLLTDTEGASAVFRGSLVVYCNDAKARFGVSPEVTGRYGIYSAETALEMARAGREAFGTELGIGVTGSFGNPDPANPDSVPGEVFFAVSFGNTRLVRMTEVGEPSRFAAKRQVADAVADALLELLLP